MKYSAFEQAAVEARSGLKEIDAEIDRLKAKKALLESLGRQLLTVLPMCSETDAADDNMHAGASEDAAAAEEAANALPEGKPFTLRKDGWPSSFPGASKAGEPTPARQTAPLEALPDGKPFSLRKEGWPSYPAAGATAEAPAAETLLRAQPVEV